MRRINFLTFILFKMSCCKGPGFKSPLEAYNDKNTEKFVFLPLIPTGDKVESLTAKLGVVDVDPNSQDYGKVLQLVDSGKKGAELHHSAWNACSSSCDDPSKERRFLILPELHIDGDIFIFDTKDPRNVKLHKVVSGKEIREKFNLTYPHSGHCLPEGIVISYMGDKDGENKGGFLLMDHDFNPLRNWNKDDESPKYGYDFWIQPRFDVLVTSSWGSPNEFSKGFDPSKVASRYGRELSFWSFKDKKVLQTVDLGEDGLIPLELRFLHNPDKCLGFVGAALSSNVIAYYKENKDDKEWKIKKVIDVAPYEVENWALPHMPGLITDILVSLDDKYLYFSNWLHGDIRQYDISDPLNPKLTGQVFLGGSLMPPVKVKDPNFKVPSKLTVKGVQVEGSPQMIQLSRDGRRLYVTTSLYSAWDKQFYPDMYNKGSQLLMVNVDRENGGLKLNEDFIVNFEGYLAHEVRYEGGDCTSDIWY